MIGGWRYSAAKEIDAGFASIHLDMAELERSLQESMLRDEMRHRELMSAYGFPTLQDQPRLASNRNCEFEKSASSLTIPKLLGYAGTGAVYGLGASLIFGTPLGASVAAGAAVLSTARILSRGLGHMALASGPLACGYAWLGYAGKGPEKAAWDIMWTGLMVPSMAAYASARAKQHQFLLHL